MPATPAPKLDTIFALLQARATGSHIFASLVVVSAIFAAKMNNLRALIDMNTVFMPQLTALTGSHVTALRKRNCSLVTNRYYITTYLLVISSTRPTCQFGAVALDAHAFHYWRPNHDDFISAVHTHTYAAATGFATFASLSCATALVTAVYALLGKVAFLLTPTTGPTCTLALLDLAMHYTSIAPLAITSYFGMS